MRDLQSRLIVVKSQNLRRFVCIIEYTHICTCTNYYVIITGRLMLGQISTIPNLLIISTILIRPINIKYLSLGTCIF